MKLAFVSGIGMKITFCCINRECNEHHSIAAYLPETGRGARVFGVNSREEVGNVPTDAKAETRRTKDLEQMYSQRTVIFA